jgi:L-ascorbate metabolism protein UlaG (beta-lactamase superfamily)
VPTRPDEPTSPTLSVRLVGGPTAVLEYAGLRWLTDPTFSAPGEYAGGLVRTSGPAIAIEELGRIDVVLVSHDHHSDNLDPAGRDLLPHAAHVFTTKAGAGRLGGGAVGLDPWESVTLDRPDGARVCVTALPALHGPPGCEQVMGPVIGFLLSGEDLETVYVSGDNASLDVVREIAERAGPVDVAVLFAGAAQLARRFDGSAGYRRPRTSSMSRPRMRPPSARNPLCSYSLVTHGRRPRTWAAVSSENARSTYMSSV